MLDQWLLLIKRSDDRLEFVSPLALLLVETVQFTEHFSLLYSVLLRKVHILFI